MGMAQRTYGGIPDRKIRPIITDFENGQYRNAMKQIAQLEPKFTKSAYIPALKALVGEKMGKHEEALQWCLEAKEKLLNDLPALSDDRMLNAVHAVCQKLGRMDIAISCYEYATDTVSSSLDFLYGLFNCYIRVSAFLKQQQTALKMYKLSGEEMYLMWALCSMQLQVLHGRDAANLFPLAEGLIKKHLVRNSLLEPEALLVHISVLEQQGKYDIARDVLLESGPNLLVIEVDRLRIEGRLLARACDYAAAAEVFMRILQLCNDDWECFLDYLGCLLEDDSRWCSLTTGGPQTFPPRIVACKLHHLSDEEFDSRIAQASEFIQNLPAVTESLNMRGPYWAKIEIERRKRLRGKDNEMKEAIYDYFDRFGHLHSFVFDIEMFLQDFSKDEMFELHNNLLTKTTKEESIAAFNKMVTISGVREWFGIMFKQPLQDTEKVNVHRGDLYREMLKLSKNLDPQEAVQGQELLCMACNVLVQLFWRTHQLGYLVEAIVVLESGLNIRRNYWQYKTLLVHLYSYFGVLPLAYKRYRTLDIKNIKLETVWHHIVPQMLLSTHWANLAEILHGYISFMEDHFKESPDFIFPAYQHRNYTKRKIVGRRSLTPPYLSIRCASFHASPTIDDDASARIEKRMKKFEQMLEQIEAEMKKSAVNQTSLQAMERKFAAYEEVIAKMCMEAREAKFVGNEELLVRMSSNIEALKSENAALKLLHVHNKFGGLRLTVAGSVCSVLGIGLALLWRLQDQAAKIKDLERQLENEDLYEERHDELVAQNNAILHHQRKPWYHWMWLREQVEIIAKKPRRLAERQERTLKEDTEEFDWFQRGRSFEFGNLFEW